MKKFSFWTVLIVFLSVLMPSGQVCTFSQETCHIAPQQTIYPANTAVYYEDQVLVLMYHLVAPDPVGDAAISPERFDDDLSLLLESGFNFISVQELVDFTEGKGAIPPNAVVVTFDDGYRGTYEFAFPILEKYEIPAAVFLIGEHIGKLPGFLTWDQVRAMEASGLITIGGHTYNQHQRLCVSPGKEVPATVGRAYNPLTGYRETQEAYLKRITADSWCLQETFQTELGHTTPYFAYPYGAYSPDFRQVLHNTGFRYIFTVLQGANGKGQNCTLYYRVNAGRPSLTSEQVLELLKTTAQNSSLQQPLQPSWMPIWQM